MRSGERPSSLLWRINDPGRIGLLHLKKDI
jgi:hypothetical protein